MKKIVLAAAVSAALSPAAFAADPMTIVITASRTEQAAADVTTPITVITKEDIEQQQPKSVAEAIALTPGLQMTSNGGYGQESTLYLRGIDQNRMLVLVDGVQIGSATKGDAKLQHIPIDQIERIEIVRGARSSLYGSGAVAGVIQIFTKKTSRNESYAEIEAGIGNHNTRQASASTGWSNGKSKISASISQFSTDGFDVRPDKSANGADDDGYSNQAFKFDAEHSQGKYTFLAGTQYIQGEADYDGFSGTNDRVTEFKYTSLYAGINANVNQDLNIESKVSSYEDNNQTVIAGVDQNQFVTNTKKFEIKSDLALGEDLLLISGLDHKTDSISGSGVKDYDVTSNDNTAVFLLLEQQTNRYSMAGSLRTDHNEAFGNFNTYGVEASLNLSQQLSVLTSYATAFKAPTFNNLYWPNDGSYVGNTEVKPEHSETASLGLKYIPQQWASFEATGYRTTVEDMITWQTNSSGLQSPTNTDAVQITGIELSGQIHLGNTELLINTEYLLPEITENSSKPEREGNILSYRAQRKTNLRISQKMNKLTVGLDAQYTGERYTDDANTNKLPGYTLLNLDSQYQISKKLVLAGSVKNLTDKEYVSKKGYATAGRTVFGSVRYRF